MLPPSANKWLKSAKRGVLIAPLPVGICGAYQKSWVRFSGRASHHNDAEVGVSKKLTYSPTLASSAQAWADHLKTSSHCQMRHSNSKARYGENLYWGSALSWSDGHKALQKVSSEQVWVCCCLPAGNWVGKKSY
ncbi:MAG: CAP domain-containing protein [Methylotenera sp.]|nr:CAP domain-containing protein [Methylotenera sp.]MDO9233898.1 CAP domain-containing protein [Methylotenera sp.]MDO9387948.1 CAP domain-containing protein [Methylotenera sp.]MDP2102742.1 CAP domain-containing protein [Methylotenera sp.]MDP2282382.1 CAP domain-containing protein [Methylotenera sp.]